MLTFRKYQIDFLYLDKVEMIRFSYFVHKFFFVKFKVRIPILNISCYI